MPRRTYSGCYARVFPVGIQIWRVRGQVWRFPAWRGAKEAG